MDKNLQDYIIRKTEEMTSVAYCCKEARVAAEIWLASIRTENEYEATEKYMAELENDLLPIDIYIYILLFVNPNAAQKYLEKIRRRKLLTLGN